MNRRGVKHSGRTVIGKKSHTHQTVVDYFLITEHPLGLYLFIFVPRQFVKDLV